MYNFKEVEKKWQDKWFNEKSFKAVDFHPTKPKYYVLYEFYNISGNLHMGHLKGTVPADALSRMKRLQGYNVLFPIGGDAFGLPAENAAIKTGINPEDFVKNGMKKAMEQSRRIGLSFDWDRTICTSDPSYYKWTQWIFKKFLENGKAYKQKGVVNFCPNCKTVLSNEDSQGGECDRCHGKVVQEDRWVWFLKMKEYSEKLLENVDRIDMNESLKELQRNWIGKSEGMEISFDIVDKDDKKLTTSSIFTTCIETIYGITFFVMAPEHKLIDELKDSINNYDEVKEYQKQTTYRSELDRISDQKEKTGCVLDGIYAINPINGNKVPIYISDFVLANYGTGIVMAVPTHDQRDYEFAKKFNIPMIQVIDGSVSKQAYEKYDYIKNNNIMMNSEEFDGMPVKEAKEKIIDKIIKLGFGKKQINYKMQDWSFNRQRYWGEPFPVVFCDKCGTVPLNDSDLPLTLPKTNDYMPNESGNSPLSKIDKWVNCKCPKCGGPAKRETDTMPNWAGSSWYWLRYCDPHNDNALADFEKLKYWGSVDCYTGGTEHITRHVLYAFFWQNFLYEIGAVPTRDPFIRKMGSGLILDDTGKKMSKSSTNGVSPMQVIDEYGTDVARLHVHFLGGYEDNTPWTYDGISGITSFINRVWDLKDIVKDGGISEEHIYEINGLIKKITEDIENLKMNTAIASFMTFINVIKKDKFITKEELRIFLILLNPLAPHITSEMYEMIFGGNIIDDEWPKYDEEYLERNEINLPIQINGKMKKTILIDSSIEDENIIIDMIKSEYPDMIKKDIKKVIYIKGKIINIIC
ncbi:MAG TPA: leucine--tRNA ligase [Candidatus Onthousia faecigallinarum]|nr:leucine--tRNA ligase [Candidatus Onthousia faecigallinarum]